MTKLFKIETRKRVTVLTDPQRRVYNGCMAKSEQQWTEWDWLETELPEERVEKRLAFWRDLSEYSVSVGGSGSQYRAVEMAA